ncbi:MAG: gephyrin-like molybdotransferase Glp, partial [Myxococcota bacterium]|nr:gephyrin-like molybdotransferase Glp [Myxococcota bacterium]
GAPLPPGADLVVMREWTEEAPGESVRVLRVGPGPGDNVRSAGEDVAAGAVCVPAGRPLEAADLALLAAQGMTRLDCRRRPRVAILSTGDEVQQPGDPLPPGHIYCGNSHALAALVREAGGVPRLLGIARDTPESLREHFERVGDADALVTIGGVSVGDFDFVKEVATELGAEQQFWKVAMRPGKPNAYGQLQGVPWWGLPGNPVSSMVSFLQYVRPALLKMQGRHEIFLPTLEARLAHEITSRKRFLFLYRGIVRPDPEGSGYIVTSTGPQGSGIMRSMADANCLISVPEDVEHLPEGARVQVQLLPRTGPAQAEPGLRRD